MGRYFGVVPLAAVAMVVMLGVACGGSDGSVPVGVPAVSTATAMPATPTPVPTAVVAPDDNPGTGHASDLGQSVAIDFVSQGEEIFQRTAGGVGCQYCHGTDAAGAIGPALFGRGTGDITGAMDRVEMMGFLYLEPEEIRAVAAYLATLSPPVADQ